MDISMTYIYWVFYEQKTKSLLVKHCECRLLTTTNVPTTTNIPTTTNVPKWNGRAWSVSSCSYLESPRPVTDPRCYDGRFTPRPHFKPRPWWNVSIGRNICWCSFYDALPIWLLLDAGPNTIAIGHKSVFGPLTPLLYFLSRYHWIPCKGCGATLLWNSTEAEGWAQTTAFRYISILVEPFSVVSEKGQSESQSQHSTDRDKVEKNCPAGPRNLIH